MAVNRYRKFKISVDENSKKTQGLHIGDIVRRQYFDDPNVIYSLMCVMDTGFDMIPVVENGETVEKKRNWFIGALLEGDAPKTDEVLDFVRVTNLWDANRLGALYLTADDEASPYMDVIDGIPVEQSLCYPTSLNNVDWEDNFSQYNVLGKAYLTAEYTKSYLDNYRICKMTKDSSANSDGVFLGLSQTINKQLGNPDCVMVSYKIRSNRPMNNLIATLGYEDGTNLDGTLTVESGTEWQYRLHMIVVDNSDRYKRTFKLNINDNLKEGDFVEVADFNIVLLSSVANFAGGMKVRIGRLDGVTDPIFGQLEDYGAYIQRLYATNQVNIAGTLTAGDENGFGSTFYAGKIHKNVVINSIACDFDTRTEIVPTTDNPVGIGEVYKIEQETVLNVQTNEWLLGKINKQYCLSFWLKSNIDCDVLVSQNEFSIKTISVPGGDTWARYVIPFQISQPLNKEAPLKVSLLPSNGTLHFTAPQLEKGPRVTQYQPTDDVLSYVEDYGAWFAKGGIGGTIQNPLLRLNDDGSISSRDNSFIINNDGTGQFANGRFKWNHDTITLQDVTIKWEDLDDEAHNQMKPKSIKIIGATSFMVDRDKVSPESITLQLHETNFTSSSSNRKWYYVGTDGQDVLLEGENGRNLVIFPDAAYWNNNSTLVIKCVVTLNFGDCVDTITIQRVEHGEDSYSVKILATNGNTFKNGIGSTTLVAHVFRGGEDITKELTVHDFDWIKTSDNPDTDRIFNASHVGWGNSLTITSEDVWNMAQFDCKVRIN